MRRGRWQSFVYHRLSCLAHNNYAAVKDLFEICIALSAPKGLAGFRSASYQQRQPWFKSFAAPPRHSKRQTFGRGASYKWRPEDFLQTFQKHFETNGWNCVDFWLFLHNLSTFWTTLRYLASLVWKGGSCHIIFWKGELLHIPDLWWVAFDLLQASHLPSERCTANQCTVLCVVKLIRKNNILSINAKPLQTYDPKS